MMLRLLSPRGARPLNGPQWTWQARIPVMILAYGAAMFGALVAERLMHSALSASYAAYAVVPGGLAAGICAFALSFSVRARLFILAAVVIVALLPLGVILISFDFQDYWPIVAQRAPRLAGVFACAIALATSLLIVGGVFPEREKGMAR